MSNGAIEANDTNRVERIMQMLPHRYPFLMIDRILESVKNEYAICLKNVTINEPHFQGHFPQQAVMPGVLIVEAMAQTSAALVVDTLGEDAEGKLVYFMSIEDARFRKPVVPGDSLHIKAVKQRQRGNVWKFACEAHVGTTRVADATVCAMIVND